MLLMEEAERIAREEHGSVKLAVISGVFLIYFSPHRVSLLNMISNRSRNPRLLQKVGIRVGWALHEQVADLANVCSHWIHTASRGYHLYITWITAVQQSKWVICSLSSRLSYNGPGLILN